MADSYGRAYSNFFKVKDKTAFLEWVQQMGLKVSNRTINGEEYFFIHPEHESINGSIWPTSRPEIGAEDLNDEDAEQEGDYYDEDIDVAAELAPHLAEGSVAVLLQCGFLKFDFLYGYAVAVNSKGEKVEIDTRDIYKRAAHLGTDIIDY